MTCNIKYERKVSLWLEIFIDFFSVVALLLGLYVTK
jgi:hypothetical protein